MYVKKQQHENNRIRSFQSIARTHKSFKNVFGIETQTSV